MPNFEPGQTVGIDLGTSYSAVGRLGADGEPEILQNKYGEEITASMVCLGRGQVVTVGRWDSQLAQSSQHVVTAVKRMVGNPSYYLVYEGRRVNAEFISAMILRRLLIDAESQIGEIANAVVTVPYYFNDLCRRATINAGKIAGVNVVDLLNEPTAATLAYAWGQREIGAGSNAVSPKRVLVYDLGGGTFDVTVVEYTPTQFRVLATDGDTLLGGLDWTSRLVGVASDRVVEALGFDPRQDPELNMRVTRGCDLAKAALSRKPRAKIDLVLAGQELTVEVTRREFESLTADLLQRTKDTTELVLEQASVQPEDLEAVVLVGGSTYMPAVQQMLTELTGRPPSTVLHPQLAVAQGAAIHAAMLEVREFGDQSRLAPAVRQGLAAIEFTDVNAHSLGVAITDPNHSAGERNHVMIGRNQPLPFSTCSRFFTTKSNPEGIAIRLLEGDATEVDACTFIGLCRITGLPENLPAGSPVEVTYSYDDDRHIRVTAKELTGGAEASVAIDRAGSLDDASIRAFQELAASYEAN